MGNLISRTRHAGAAAILPLRWIPYNLESRWSLSNSPHLQINFFNTEEPDQSSKSH